MGCLNEECRGCYMYKYKCILNSSYTDPKTNETIKCPCIDCIIKMMCKDGITCEEYQNYQKYRCRLESEKIKGHIEDIKYEPS